MISQVGIKYKILKYLYKMYYFCPNETFEALYVQPKKMDTQKIKIKLLHRY